MTGEGLRVKRVFGAGLLTNVNEHSISWLNFRGGGIGVPNIKPGPSKSGWIPKLHFLVSPDVET